MTVVTVVGLGGRETAVADTSAGQYAEQWANLSGWSDVGVSVSGGRLYGSGASTTGATRAMPVDGDSRLRASIVLAPKGTGGLTAVGVSTAAPGAAPSGAHLVGIGFNAVGQPVAYRGSAAGGTGLTVLDSVAQVGGWYWVTVTTDAYGLQLVLTNSDGSKEWRTAIKRSTLPAPIGNAAVWVSDTRGTTGSSVGPLGYGLSAAPIAAGAGIEDRTHSASWGWGPNGTALHIALPAGYDGTEPLPLVIYAHGSTGTELSVFGEHLNDVYTALLASGYAVASSSQHGNNWGNTASVDDLTALYEYVNVRYPVGEVFLLGQSMGGLSSLQAAAADDIPVTAWAGIYPVTNLRAMWDQGRYRSQIAGAHGALTDGTDYAAKIAPHDPTTYDPSVFDGLPMRFYASPEDRIVPASQNTDTFASAVSGHATEGEIVPHVGEHGDPTAFNVIDLIRFFDRHR